MERKVEAGIGLGVRWKLTLVHIPTLTCTLAYDVRTQMKILINWVGLRSLRPQETLLCCNDRSMGGPRRQTEDEYLNLVDGGCCLFPHRFHINRCVCVCLVTLRSKTHTSICIASKTCTCTCTINIVGFHLKAAMVREWFGILIILRQYKV